MTVTRTNTFDGPYFGNGATTVFPFTFDVNDSSEVAVTVDDNPVVAGFAVTVNDGGEGGSVTFTAAPANGAVIYLSTNPAFDQPSSFLNAGQFLAQTHDLVADRADRRDLYLRGLLSRTALVPVGETLGGLPRAADRANLYFGFDADGNPTVFTGNTGADASLRGDLAAAGGSALVSFLQSGAGAVTLSLQQRLRNGFLMPEDFGAKGDGVTNDTAAFQALAAVVNGASGGAIMLRPGAVYIVGVQTLVNNGNVMWNGADILYFHGCTKAITIIGNGATLKFAAGLKYGTFDAAGNPTDHGAGYTGGELSVPVNQSVAGRAGLISFDQCSGPIHLSDFEIDGNVQNMQVSGHYGDAGIQANGDGIFGQYNTGGVRLESIHCHHLPRDGALFAGIYPFGDTGNDIARNPHTFVNCTFELAQRNCFSWIGGRGGKWSNCRFLYGGRTDKGLPTASAPASCFDAESNFGSIRDLAFEDCEFVGGANTSFVSDQNDTKGLYFKRCIIDNPQNYAFWIGADRLVMEDCRLFGQNIYFNPPDLKQAGRFVRCKFTDKDGESMTGANQTFLAAALFITGGGGAHGANAHFYDCTFEAQYSSMFAATGTIHHDTKLDQITANLTVGNWGSTVFRGKTELNYLGAVPAEPLDQAVSLIGTFITNGTQQCGGTFAWDAPSIASGASASTTFAVPKAKLGRKVDASFDISLGGLSLNAYVSAANTVTVVLTNNTGGAVDLGNANVRIRVFDIDNA